MYGHKESEYCFIALAAREPLPATDRGCRMVYFQTKNPNMGKFGREWNRMENVCIFYDH
jgi:hypothetical protein